MIAACAGRSNANTTPSPGAIAHTHPVVTWPMAVTVPKIVAIAAANELVTSRMCRAERRSVITPAYGESSSTGRYCSAAAMPSAAPLWERSRISSDWATIWNQVPNPDSTWPTR